MLYVLAVDIKKSTSLNKHLQSTGENCMLLSGAKGFKIKSKNSYTTLSSVKIMTTNRSSVLYNEKKYSQCYICQGF